MLCSTFICSSKDTVLLSNALRGKPNKEREIHVQKMQQNIIKCCVNTLLKTYDQNKKCGQERYNNIKVSRNQ